MPLWLRRVSIVALVVLPPTLFVALGGRYFLPDNLFWASVAVLGVYGVWIAALAGLAEITGYTARELWSPRPDPVPAVTPPPVTPDPPASESVTPSVSKPTTLPDPPEQPMYRSINPSTSRSTDDPFEYDVFISYSHHDEVWVEKTLLPTLEDAGVKVCIDFRDFTAGKAALFNMQDAVKNSRHTLLVLTGHWVGSEWTLYEAILARTKDPAGLQRRTIPVRLEKCDLPDSISMLTWVDFTRPDRLDIAWNQLLTALGAPPEQKPVEPATPVSWHLAHPYAMPPNFTGRRAERAMLTDWLANDEHPLLVIRALGGFGKSALAWHWLLNDVDAAQWPRVVWWSFYEPQATVESFLAETLAYLGVDLRRYPNPRQQADALLNILRQPGTLLILDGFERALRAYSSMMAAYQGDMVEGELATGADTLPKLTINHPPLPDNHSQRDCVSPIAEHFLRGLATLPGLRGKALMTTRLTPRILVAHDSDLLLGCREEELTQMQPADAVAFFRTSGIRGGRAEIEAACDPYGYHPLSLRLLAGWIKKDIQQPGDIAAARRLDVTGDLVQRQHHVLEVSYSSLPPAQQALLSRIACFRGPVAYDALAAVATQSQTSDFSSGKPSLLDRAFGRGKQVPDDEKKSEVSPAQLDAALRDLIERGSLHRDDRSNRFDLHPIVRRYAYDRLTGEARAATHAGLRDYFAAVPPSDKPQTLDDLAPVIELYHHTLAAGQYDEAFTLFRNRINKATYYQFGAYQLQIELLAGLFPDGDPSTGSGQGSGQVATLPRLTKESDQAWTLNELANSYSLSGQPRRAVPLFETMNASFEKRDDKKNLAIGLGNLATQQMVIGALRDAEANLRREIELCREIEDEENEGTGIYELGRVLSYCGRWDEAAAQFDAAEVIKKRTHHVQAQGIIWAYRALRSLLMARDLTLTSNSSPAGRGESDALDAARRALEMADETARTRYPHERDYVDAHWLLGAAWLANGYPSTALRPGSGQDSGQTLDAADRHLTEALTRCRSINAVDAEADILLDLARLRRGSPSASASAVPPPRGDAPSAAQGGETPARVESLRLAHEALAITERSGYVLQGADVHLFLAQLALDTGDRDAALDHARQARQLATCDGPPDYTYKVAYEEAGALLEMLGAGDGPSTNADAHEYTNFDPR